MTDQGPGGIVGVEIRFAEVTTVRLRAESGRVT